MRSACAFCFASALIVSASASPPLLPAGVRLGEDVSEARPKIGAACARTDEVRYTGADAAPAKKEQIQINCHGIAAYGAARSVEFMFNDGSLAFLWILLEPSDLPAAEAALTKEYGPVVARNGGYKLFEGGASALRTEPPEILIATPDMMAGITGLKPQ